MKGISLACAAALALSASFALSATGSASAGGIVLGPVPHAGGAPQSGPRGPGGPAGWHGQVGSGAWRGPGHPGAYGYAAFHNGFGPNYGGGSVYIHTGYGENTFAWRNGHWSSGTGYGGGYGGGYPGIGYPASTDSTSSAPAPLILFAPSFVPDNVAPNETSYISSGPRIILINRDKTAPTGQLPRVIYGDEQVRSAGGPRIIYGDALK
jgi:hypothetical protein